MSRYRVRVWIDDIDVDADSPKQAQYIAMDMVDDGSIQLKVEYAEVRDVLVDGKWEPVPCS